MPKNTEKTKLDQPKEEEEEYEDWCFDCKDGGQLVICDYKKCRKVYHPECVGKDDTICGSFKSWRCGRHFCYNCEKRSKFYCLGCPNSVCKNCISVLEFTLVRRRQGLCCDCFDIVQIIEQNLDHDSDGNKITLDDRETYECLFKEYWELLKVREGITDDDVSAALSNNSKGKDFKLHTAHSEGGEEKQNDDVSAALYNNRKGKDFELNTTHSKGGEEKQNDSDNNEDYADMHKPKKRKRYSSVEFFGWASQPLSSFLASIGRYGTEPMMQWGVKSLICEYIKEKNLYHPKDKRKFLPDEKLLPIFKKKVVWKHQIYSLLESHIAEKSVDSSKKENQDQNKNCSIDDRPYMENRLSKLMEKPLLKKGDLMIKPGCFALINFNNITLVYLKQSLVLELSKERESFAKKVVGTFVRARVESNEHKHMNLYHLVKVIGVVHDDEMPNRILLQVSFMAKAIPISELSNEDFTEQECEDLRQKVNSGLLPKLTVVDLEEKAISLHEDITKHWIATRLVDLEIKIERANLRGRTKEKIALLDEREELEQEWKQEQLLRCVPSVFPELVEEKYGDSDSDE